MRICSALLSPVQDTLVNHKRELLMEHKIQSTVLQNDMGDLAEQRERFEAQRVAFLKDIAGLEGSIKEVERQMNVLGKTSAIQDGRVNVAHAKKKRRLDQEFEKLLERAQERKESMVAVDEKIRAVDDERNRKEDALKELERQLVELLVEQQKKLLEVLSAFNSTLKKNKKKHGARRKKAIQRADAAAAKEEEEANEGGGGGGGGGGGSARGSGGRGRGGEREHRGSGDRSSGRRSGRR